MKKLLLLFVLTACGGGGEKAVEKFEGTASIGGKPATITSCKAVGKADGQVQYVTIELGLDTGLTVIVDGYDGMKIRKDGETTKPSDCSKTQSNMNHGRDGSKAWASGDVSLQCTIPDGELVIDATYDCGSASRRSNRVERDKK